MCHPAVTVLSFASLHSFVARERCDESSKKLKHLIERQDCVHLTADHSNDAADKTRTPNNRKVSMWKRAHCSVEVTSLPAWNDSQGCRTTEARTAKDEAERLPADKKATAGRQPDDVGIGEEAYR